MIKLTDEHIPEIKVMEKAFDDLQNSNISFSTSEEVLKYLFEHFKFVPRLSWSSDKIGNFKLYRVRKESTFKNEDLHDPLSFSFPPPELCKLGRANLPGKPVLYACDNQFTAIVETDISKDEIFYLSEWELIIYPLCLLFVQLFDNISPENRWYNIYANMLKSMLNDYIYLSEKSIASLKFLNSAYSNLFVKTNPKSYLISAAIADNLIYHDHEGARTIGIIYPSVKNNLLSINFAINWYYTINNIKLKHIQKLIMTDNPKAPGLISTGTLNGDTISWE